MSAVFLSSFILKIERWCCFNPINTVSHRKSFTSTNMASHLQSLSYKTKKTSCKHNSSMPRFAHIRHHHYHHLIRSLLLHACPSNYPIHTPSPSPSPSPSPPPSLLRINIPIILTFPSSIYVLDDSGSSGAHQSVKLVGAAGGYIGVNSDCSS